MTERPSGSGRTRLLMMAVTIALAAVYAGSVLLATRDQQGQIDSKEVKPAAEAACSGLKSGLGALQLPQTPTGVLERVALVDEQAALVDRFVAEITEVGDKALQEDVPSLTWISDWRALVQARRDFAAGGFVGNFSLPIVAGEPITRRMDAIGIASCMVPQSLRESP